MEQVDVLKKGLEQLIHLVNRKWDFTFVVSSGIWTSNGWHWEGGILQAFDLMYFSEGSAQLTLHNRKLEVNKGDVVFHDYQYRSMCEPSVFKLFYITIGSSHPETFEELTRIFSLLISVSKPVKTANVEDFFLDAFQEEAAGKPFSSLAIKQRYLNILIHLYRRLGFQDSEGKYFPFNHRKGDIADRIQKILNGEYSGMVSLKSLGRRLGLNPRYMGTVFKEINEVTVRQYLIRIRLNAAKKLLRYTSMKVVDIALETGFGDGQHFCKTFKKHIGNTPLEFRDSVQTIPEETTKQI
ncbi:MAG TPA: AraC family transcriptional regulator [bacterium]|nr:AraC family transcriptional regulator [bacterium]